MQDEASIAPRRRLVPRPLLIAGALLLLAGGGYVALAFRAARGLLDEREAYQAQLRALVALGERHAAQMAAAGDPPLVPLERACAGRVPQGGARSLLGYLAGPAPELNEELEAASSRQLEAMRGSLAASLRLLGPAVPLGQLAGLTADGVLWSGGAGKKGPPLDSSQEVDALLAQAPVGWSDYARRKAHFGPDLSAARTLAVTMVRAATLPEIAPSAPGAGLELAPSPASYVGGQARVAVRLVAVEGGALRCEGQLFTGMPATVTSRSIFASSVSEAKQQAREGMAGELRAAFQRHLAMTPLSAAATLGGDAATAHAARCALSPTEHAGCPR